MKHISILVPKGAHIGPIDGTHLLFSEVNAYLSEDSSEPLFRIQLVGVSKETSLKNGLYSAHAELLLNDVEKTDLIIIPAALLEDLEKTIQHNKDLIPWIVKQYNAGAEVASLCIGAFILASTGLLKGRKCATHAMFANAFRKMFPDVDLVADKIITDQNGIYSSGGAFSYLNLILYLIEKYAGRQAAVH